MKPRTPIRLTARLLTYAMPSWLREERRNEELETALGREKRQHTNIGARVGMCRFKHFIMLQVDYERLPLLELIPIKSLQRASVCQRPTPLPLDEQEQRANSV